MKNKNLRGLEQDLNRGIEYNRKHGGVSDELKSVLKRPENPNFSMNAFSRPYQALPTDKCKCGGTKFEYQKVCYKCHQKSKNI
jgi:hypothetical protein